MNGDLLNGRADIWRGAEMPPAARAGVPTGFRELDALLPGGGWPQGALTEILADSEAVGALRLVMPALARLSETPRWLAWIAPPHVPYAPALAAGGVTLSRVLLVHPRERTDRLWALEQALRSGTCSTVLAWLAGAGRTPMRRLQLAAEAGDTWGVLFRPSWALRESSAAALRLHVEAVPGGVSVRVLKRRGGWAAAPVTLELAPRA